jgi:hypothetical protein
MSDPAPYNPLDKQNLGASVAEALLGRKVHPLGSISRFNGAGIYAIYFTGNFPAYSALVKRNQDDQFEAPIYVGKAIPEGGRKGGGKSEEGTTRALYSRLNDHAKSIRASTNLSIEDFHCRYLVVDDIWIPLGESLLIAKFAPVWNSLVDGFGNHDPGSGRYQGMRPRWDVLHPGRDWAEKCKPRDESADEIVADIASYLSNIVIPKSPHFLVEQVRKPYKP